MLIKGQFIQKKFAEYDNNLYALNTNNQIMYLQNSFLDKGNIYSNENIQCIFNSIFYKAKSAYKLITTKQTSIIVY